jgi:HSP20 family molecular chaperone IbpA
MNTLCESTTQAQADPRARRLPVASDLYETDAAWIVALALSGVRIEDVDVQLVSGNLTIRARRRAFQREGFERVQGLLGPGHYELQISVPKDLRAEDVSADLAHGILRVTLAKPAPKKSSIPVQLG